MTSRPATLFAVSLALCAAGCGNFDASDPREYFDRHKSGTSPDYGIMRFGSDHVATIHGFVDDLEMCLQIADSMNKTACAETGGNGCLNPFSCRALNH